MLPKRFSSCKFIYTICLVNVGNFLITHTMIFVILKKRMKWCLFDGIPFIENSMGWLVIVESRWKTFSTTCVLFWRCFAWKKIYNMTRTTIQVIDLNAIFSFGTERSKCFGSYNMLAYFAPTTPSWFTTALFLFERCYFHFRKKLFQAFSSSKLNYRNLFENLALFSTSY